MDKPHCYNTTHVQLCINKNIQLCGNFSTPVTTRAEQYCHRGWMFTDKNEKVVMTAIVGILNRQGLAFAADSAATLTISSTHKITNHANKIFELSKFEPVGIAMYGNMDFMKMPWEQIIKMYRKKVSNMKFDTLEEYSNDFWAYVRNLASLYQEDKHSQEQVKFFVDSFYNEILKLTSDKLKAAQKELTDENIVQNMMEEMRSINEIYKQNKVCQDCQNLTLESFTSIFNECVSNKITQCLVVPNCPAEFKETFIETLYFIVRSSSHIYTSSTGLVFFGYGDKELMPVYHSFKISDLFKDKLKITKEGEYIVDIDKGACLAPFAQTDVTNTVVRGIDDDLRSVFYDKNEQTLSLLLDTIVSKLAEAQAPQKLIDILTSLDIKSMSKVFKDDMDDYIWKNYVSKLMDIVKFLGKEDLAEMAESLIKMTGLKRHVTTDEESVGGPVDVAVVTKCDGFVWIKRKHYFSPEFNPNYFQRTKLY